MPLKPFSPLSKVLEAFVGALQQYLNPRVLTIGCISYANGLPLLLTSKTLGIWLESYGINYTSIGLFGLMHLPYTFKFLWAPILDHTPLPFLHKLLGQRRSWLFLTQLTAIMGLLAMIALDPIQNMIPFVACGFLVTFSAASQHVLLLAFQIESLETQNWGIGESMGVFGFRMAILTGGAGALYLATFFTWKEVYFIITLLMLIGLFAPLLAHTPKQNLHAKKDGSRSPQEWIAYAVIQPFKEFMTKQGWWAILVFMLIYRLPENLLGMMQTLFLLNLGFTYVEVASVEKVYGLGATILGGIIGGYIIRSYGFKSALLWGGIGYGLSLVLFLLQAHMGPNLSFLYVAIGIEHLFSGLSLTAFFSYQLTCCSIRFAVTQLALLTSFASLPRTFASPIAGYAIDSWGWIPFIILVIFSSLPGILWLKVIPHEKV